MTDPRQTNGASEAESDPFEDFNRAQGQGEVVNPYPKFAEWRRQAPVLKVSFADMLGRDQDLPGELPDVYAVVTHNAVSEVLRDGARFSSSGYALQMGPVMGKTILQMDEPEHSRYRSLIQQAFSRKAIENWNRDLIKPVIDGLVDRFVERGKADLVRELTFPFPVAVIAGMIGIPEADQSNFHRWAVELISVGFDPQRGLAASRKLGDYFAGLLAQRRQKPENDLMSVLAAAELDDGTHLEDDEIFAFLRLLAPAGAETTYRSSSNLLRGLLGAPEQLEAVRKDRSLLPQAIEEGLRWECPLLSIMRTATCDTEVGGVKLPAGAFMNVNMGSANHDETRYENPDVFDIFRPQRQHMAFAFGPHRCLGMHLARAETVTLLNTLLDRLPGLRLDPDLADSREAQITGLIFRSPAALPVCFDGAA